MLKLENFENFTIGTQHFFKEKKKVWQLAVDQVSILIEHRRSVVANSEDCKNGWKSWKNTRRSSLTKRRITFSTAWAKVEEWTTENGRIYRQCVWVCNRQKESHDYLDYWETTKKVGSKQKSWITNGLTRTLHRRWTVSSPAQKLTRYVNWLSEHFQSHCVSRELSRKKKTFGPSECWKISSRIWVANY